MRSTIMAMTMMGALGGWGCVGEAEVVAPTVAWPMDIFDSEHRAELEERLAANWRWMLDERAVASYLGAELIEPEVGAEAGRGPKRRVSLASLRRRSEERRGGVLLWYAGAGCARSQAMGFFGVAKRAAEALDADLAIIRVEEEQDGAELRPPGVVVAAEALEELARGEQTSTRSIQKMLRIAQFDPEAGWSFPEAMGEAELAGAVLEGARKLWLWALSPSTPVFVHLERGELSALARTSFKDWPGGVVEVIGGWEEEWRGLDAAGRERLTAQKLSRRQRRAAEQVSAVLVEALRRGVSS
ncbi:MAG: hypothetical protein ACOC92_00655 [bacterium]